MDSAWQLVRRAAGHEQKQGALERIFVVTALIAVTAFCVWFFFIEGPRPSLSPKAPGEGP